MKILGIDTSTDIINLAIIEDGVMIQDYMMKERKKTHSSILIPFLDNLMKFSGYQINDFDGIAVSSGPGSFTGLRIGLATARGLAFPLGLPIIGVNTLDAYAFNWKELPGILCPLIKSRKGEYYYAFFKRNKANDTLTKINDYQCNNWQIITSKLSEFNEIIFIFGYEIADIIEESKNNINFKRKNVFINKQYPPGAVNIALIGEKKIMKKENRDIYNLVPFYINKSSAEINKAKSYRK